MSNDRISPPQTTDRQRDIATLNAAAEALVAHASRILPGDEIPDHAQIENTILLLARDPMGAVCLSRIVRRINDPETIMLVRAFISRYAADLEMKPKGGHDAVWVPVVNTTSIGGFATIGIGIAAGTLSMGLGVVMLAGFGSAAVATTYWRVRQAREEAARNRDAELVKALLPAVKDHKD